jgi:cysteinyl-tRNA synthetase
MIRFYDTMGREKREFVPADPQRITIYVCGPTVYNRAHIGNARPAVVFDTLARLLRHVYGPESVVHAANVTDIEDKIMAAAAAENVPIEVITERYSRFYFEDLAALGVPRPDIVPLATQTIPEMIAMIERLIAAGHAYATEGHVLFDVPSWPDYGKLSRRPMDEMIAGARVDVAPYKRSPADFVLWKPSSAEQPGWDSPWGRGRPGWHIECSAMIEAHLGETIDIHGGGLDLEFPHHENEVAQSTCSHGGAPLARYWLHNGMVDMGAEKMSKSRGNIVNIGELLDDGWSGDVLRLALLSAHYRSPLPWTRELLKSTKQRLDRMYFCISWFSFEDVAPPDEFLAALKDDLNTPKALAALSKIATQCLADISADLNGRVRTAEEEEAVFTRRGQLLAGMAMLGLTTTVSPPVDINESEDEISQKLRLRDDARKSKMFEEADRIRDEVERLGIIVMDFPTTTLWMSDTSELVRS